MNRIYFDHSATTPVDERVVITMNEFMLEKFGNPSSIHSFGREARQAVEEAREAVAGLISAAPEDIFFTSGGTESDNLALLGYAQLHQEDGGHVIVSAIEHPAILNTADELERLGFRVSRVKPDHFGQIQPEAVAEAIERDTILISVMHVNNEVGTVNDLKTISQVAHDHEVIFHTDAVQSFGKLPIDVSTMDIDMLSLSGHKIYGPKGIGALFIRKGIGLHQRQFGGHQESGVRAGTENLPGIIGLGRAASICRKEMANETLKLVELREELYSRLNEALDEITLNGHPTQRLAGNLNVTFNGIEGEALLMALDLEGIAVSSGSACSSGSTKPSHVLTAIGLSEEEAHSTLRITLGRGNTFRDIDYAAKVIADAVVRLRVMSGGEHFKRSRIVGRATV
jgi:cysteine desulfurase